MESAYKAGTGTEQPNLSSRFTTPIPHTPIPPPLGACTYPYYISFDIFFALSLSYVLFGYTKKHENEPEMGMRERSWGAGVLCVCVFVCVCVHE